MDFWDSLYNLFGIKPFIYLISSPELQDYLFPVKLVFASFSAFFFAGVVYFMVNSSWLQHKFLEDIAEFFSWQAYGSRQITKQWDKIKRRLTSASESEFKLAIIEADDFLSEVFENRGYEGESFQDSVKKASDLLDDLSSDVLSAHETRNTIVYDPNFSLSEMQTKKWLDIYESAINRIGLQ